MREAFRFFTRFHKGTMILVLGFLVMTAFIPKAQAKEIPQDVAVRVIVSEGADQGLKGMICIAEVLRVRGSIRGFYGYQLNRLKRNQKSVKDMAAKAWGISAHTNYTHGADHFENIHRFGQPWWVRYCVKTYEYKDHVFYKEIRKRT
ncbi:MAG: hypothetical protein HQL15_05400 [Candidatus Omnitrophica bacterium]|nr:hypothetical protein [Candidatus Omnitrophota bacterium]